eukprot:COSAG02_NODE_4725_length_5049_cov_8.780202_9_plen_40_part_00
MNMNGTTVLVTHDERVNPYCKPSRLRDILGKRFWVLGEC